MLSLETELQTRSRQQTALAALGQSAIATRDLDGLYREVLAVACRTLAVQYGVIAHAAGDGFIVRAGTGWKDEVEGRPVPDLDAVPAAYILRSSEPVVIHDAATEPHFPFSPVLDDHGVRSGMGVAIRGRVKPWGVLAVFGASARRFTSDDVGFLQSIANIVGLVIEREEIEDERRNATSALLESTARFAQMFRLSPVALAISTMRDGRIIDVNEAWLEMFGYARNDVIGRSNTDLRLTAHAPARADIIAAVERDGFVRNLEMTVRTKGGGLKNLLVSAVPVRLAGEGELWMSAQMDISERKQMEADLRALSRRLLGAYEEERRRIAVELHDDLGQILSAAKIGLDWMARGDGAQPDRLHDAIEAVDQAIHRVRDIAVDLRPSVLDDLGLSAALRWYADRFQRNASFQIHQSVDTIYGLDAAVETACFRLTQEALTNVARHAAATEVWLDLHRFEAFLEIRIRDDGRGFDVPGARARAHAGESLGLLGMEERASLAGGLIEIVSGPGAGTEVRAKFRLDDGAAPGRP